MTRSPEIPGHAVPGRGIGIPPGDGTLIARVHTGSALDAIFEPEENPSRVIDPIAFGWAHVGGAAVRTTRVAHIGVHVDVRRRVGTPLIAIGHEAETLRKAETLHAFMGDVAILTWGCYDPGTRTLRYILRKTTTMQVYARSLHPFARRPYVTGHPQGEGLWVLSTKGRHVAILSQGTTSQAIHNERQAP